MLAIDYWLFRQINALVGQWPGLDNFGRLFLNDYFIPTLLAVLLAGLWFEGQHRAGQYRNQRAVVVATASTILGNTLLKLFNVIYHRPRPFAELEVNLLFYQPTDSSFPSNAAVIGFAIAAGVWLHNRAWGWGMLLIAGLFGLSRVFGGVHFPLDVVAGAGLGCLSAWLIYRQQTLVDRLLTLMITWADRLGLS